MSRPEPNPSPCARIGDPREAGRVRRLWCSRYDWCVTVAVRLRWEGFTCVECQVNEVELRLVPLHTRPIVPEREPAATEAPDGATLQTVADALGLRGRSGSANCERRALRKLRAVALSAGLGQ